MRETNLDHVVINSWLRLAPLMLLLDMPAPYIHNEQSSMRNIMKLVIYNVLES